VKKSETSVDRDPESARLAQAASPQSDWRKWGPYLAERQWATVREDYSAGGACWDSFPHDHARSRAYRWGEDGLLGICDRQARLCFALALWNGRDPILKERLFGLTGPEGNHGEDVKELYYYLDSTPTHSYLKALYKYPQAEYPYERLVRENRGRGKDEPELELADTGVFDEGRYFDVFAEYAKAGPDDVLIRITVANRGPEAAVAHVLPTIWFRNSWSWGRTSELLPPKGVIRAKEEGRLLIEQPGLGRYQLAFEAASEVTPTVLVTENETNAERLFGAPNAGPCVKDAFHEAVVHGRTSAVSTSGEGSKAAPHYRLQIPAGGEAVLRLRLSPADSELRRPFGPEFERTFAARIREADAFYSARIPHPLGSEEHRVARQAYAGILWSKQFFYYDVAEWLDGDPAQPQPPAERRRGRNSDWRHLNNADVVSMPDKWEYPWYAAWDLAFHLVTVARIDSDFAKEQLILLLREWYMHPNGQIPAYEFAFGDVNPPVHAWACWRVYKIAATRGERDRVFLSRVFHKLLINFTWWVNRKDPEGHNLFAGGFLGLDNIGVFDRSQPLPTGGHLEQADGTAWMAFYCATMLAMALELAHEDPAAEDLATKFFEHFVAITDAMNTLGGSGLWNEEDGFYYDQLHANDESLPLKLRSLVGLVPLFTAETVDAETLDRLPDFAARFRWFVANRPELAKHVTVRQDPDGRPRYLLSVPSRDRLVRVLGYALDEEEFLSPHGIRSISRFHRDHPYVFQTQGQEFRVDYVPGESNTWLFGGNSNWRGPVWFPMNYLIVEALQRYAHFFGDSLEVECPARSGRRMHLGRVAAELSGRLARTFLPDGAGARPCHGGDPRYAADPHFKDLVLFYEYFHGDTGKGLGASHQTGWTALVARCLEDAGNDR
jgi:Mannosylglycerate hydrolase MGH1-like glycoside hydrolase domain